MTAGIVAKRFIATQQTAVVLKEAGMFVQVIVTLLARTEDGTRAVVMLMGLMARVLIGGVLVEVIQQPSMSQNALA